jgi:hypothetical protein
MSKIFREIFDIGRQKVFEQLSPFATFGYLAGGTALALQINHRKSYDFDVFVKNAIDNTLKLTVNKLWKPVYSINTSDQLSFTVENSVAITFLWYYFPLQYPCIETSSLSLASIEDIAADKASTIGRRAVWRDYVDIFYLLSSNRLSLATIITLAEKKFGNEFNSLLFLQQLSYFGDVTPAPIQYIHSEPADSEIKSYLRHEVSRYMKNILKKF